MEKRKKYIWGIGLAIVVMMVAKLLAAFLPMLGTALIALLLGIIIRQIITKFEVFQAGVVWTEKYVLETAIVLLGFGFQWSQIQEVGASTFIVIVVSIVLIVLLALLLQKLTAKSDKLFWLLGAGSAICGSAAIGATAPLIKAKEEETGISLAVINVLGLIGMLLLPVLATVLSYDATETGILIGGILQSAGHVVGASFALGDEIGSVATIVKMARIALLLPFLLMVYFLYKHRAGNATIKFPIFILLFAVTLIIGATQLLPTYLVAGLGKTSDYLFSIAMAAIGLKINLKNIWSISGKSMVYGAVIFVFQIVFFVGFIMLR